MNDVSVTFVASAAENQSGALSHKADANEYSTLRALGAAINNAKPGAADNPDAEQNLLHDLAELASRQIAERQRRNILLGIPNLFGEPAWEIMLDLFVARVSGKQVRLSSDTHQIKPAMRYIRALNAQAVVEQELDETDPTAFYVTLSDAGMDRMKQFLTRS
jgi:hypothetical protein